MPGRSPDRILAALLALALLSGSSPAAAAQAVVERVETAQADFRQGSLSNLAATANGDLKIPLPGTPGFSRASTAYRSDGSQVSTHVPRYEAGRFGQSIVVEEGVTNLLSANQSSVENDLSGLAPWSPQNSHTFVRDAADAWHGSASAKVTSNYAGSQNIVVMLAWGAFVSVSPGENYLFMTHGKSSAAAGKQWRLQIEWWGAGDNYISASAGPRQNASPSWTELYTVATAPAGAAKAKPYLVLLDAAQNESLWWDGAMAARVSHRVSWHLGGNARATETLTLPTAGAMPASEGTIEFWVKLNSLNPSGYNAMVATGGLAPGPRLLIMREFQGTAKDKIRVWDGDGVTEEQSLIGQTVIRPDTWHHVAFTWSAAGRKLYVNGNLEAAGSRSEPIGMVDTLEIGTWQLASWLDGTIDDLRISSRVRTDIEIANTYDSGEPLAADDSTTYILGFDSGLNNAVETFHGVRVSPLIGLSSINSASASSISWNATVPAGAGIVVETSLDGGGTWRRATNGGTVPGINPGDNLAGKDLLVRQTLSTAAGTATPLLHDLTVRVEGSPPGSEGSPPGSEGSPPGSPGGVTVTAEVQYEIEMSLSTTVVSLGAVNPSLSPYVIPAAVSIRVRSNVPWAAQHSLAPLKLPDGSQALPGLAARQDGGGYQAIPDAPASMAAGAATAGTEIRFDYRQEVPWNALPGPYSGTVSYITIAQ